MRRSFSVMVGSALVMVACGPPGVTPEEVATPTTFAVSTPTTETTSTTSLTEIPTTTAPTLPPIGGRSWTETRSPVPQNAVLDRVIAGPPGFVVPGWHDKIPGVQGARSGLWFSEDGSSWTEVSPTDLDLEWIQYNNGFWTGREYLVVAEGIVNAENADSAMEGKGPLLFRSEDGRDWSVDIVDAALVAAAPALGRLHMTPELIQTAGHAGFTDITAGTEGILVTGWLNTSKGIEAAVWSSSDGIAWTVRALPGAEPNVRADRIVRGHLGYVVTGGQQAIGGGGGIATVVWRSSDGRSWELLNDQSSDYPGVDPLIPDLWRVSDAAIGARGYLISGFLWSDTGDPVGHSWFSPGGSGWIEVGPFPGQNPYVLDVEGDEHGFVAVGCQTINGQPVASAWRSLDGLSWVLEPTTFAPACMKGIERAGGSWVVTGSGDHPDPAFHPSASRRATEFIIWTAPITAEGRSAVWAAESSTHS
jgi:hypothetical protein